MSDRGPGRTGTRPPRLVVVVGSGRSGTSTLAGVMKHLGTQVPQPEWPTNETNPRGFFEPEWVVRFHRRLLLRANVALDDARPAAFERTARAGSRPWARRELTGWLTEHGLTADESIVKDPRSAWFVPMWTSATEQAGGVPAFVTMLRHPAEVVGSKNRYYRQRFGTVSRTANWLNIALHTEEATRGSPRSFVRYVDLLEDWRAQITRVGKSLDLAVMERASSEQQQRVDEFIDPDLRRV
ncbi:MAG: sulfotransferase family protein, partial [Nocardioidaceae bacterium]